MHWSLIALIIVVGLIVYAIGIGATLGVWGYADEYVAKDDSTLMACIVFWWVILPFLGLVFLGRWIMFKVNKKIKV